MKYRGALLLTLLLTVSVQTRAQDNPFMNGGQLLGKLQSLQDPQRPCPDYKIGIVTPNVGTDFKMRLVVPPANLDNGIISMLCGTPQQLSLAPQLQPVPSGQNVWSTGSISIPGQGNVFFTRQGNTFVLGKPK